MTIADRTSMYPAEATCATDVGHVVARVDGALGASILVGLDRLGVCRCDTASLDGRIARAPWSYEDLEGVSIGNYGSMPVVLLQLARRADPLPVLILERGQVGAALDGLVTLRRLIATAGHSLATA